MGIKIVSKNKKAYADFQIDEKYEAGLVLQGTEVKSLREGRISLKESYAGFNQDGEVYLYHCHIPEYRFGNRANHEPLRPRKLLLKKEEIRRLNGKVKERGYTLIPLSIYFNEKGLVKAEIGLARGKRKYDKRAAIKERDLKREEERELKEMRTRYS